MQSTKPGPAISPTLLRGWGAHAIIAGMVLLFFRDILLRTSFFWEDFLYQYYAFRSFAATSLASGQLPLWNPYTFNGMPFQADIQSAIFYLPNMLLTIFAGGDHLDYWWVEVSIVAHFILAGSGMYILAKNLGLEPIFAAFSGVAYCFSGFMVGHLIHQGFIYQAAWFPLIFFFFRNALLGGRLRPMIVAGLLLGHAILAGAPQITLYIVIFLFFYYCFEFIGCFMNGRPGAVIRLSLLAAGPIVIALALTAVQLLPTAELAPQSQRADLTYEKAAEGSLGYAQLMTLAVPKFFGSSGARGSTFSYPGLAYWHYWETTGYIGIGALVFACVGFFVGIRDRFILFLGLMMLFGLLFALGNNFILHGLLHDHIPGFDNFRVPGRMVLYFGFAGSILAGFGLKHVTERISGHSPSVGKIALAFGIVAVLVFIIGQTGIFVPALPGGAGTAALSMAATESMKGAAILAVIALLVFISGWRKIAPGLFLTAIFLVQFADAHIYGFDQNNGTLDPDLYYARTASTASFLKQQGKGSYFRVNSREGGAMILDRNEGMINRIFMMEGYTPLGLSRFIPPMSTWSRTCDLMNARYRIVIDQQKRSMSLAEAAGYAPRAFFVYGVYVAASEEDAKNYISSETFDPMTEAVFEEEPPVPLSVVDSTAANTWKASITSYELNSIRLDVRTDSDGYLILSEVWYPGWIATVDGVEAPVVRVDWCLRGIPVAKGSHEVTLEFSPSSFRTGAWISGVTLLLTLAGVFFTRKGNG